MVGTDEEALACDLAETYHIYHMRALPLPMLAMLAAGLRDHSRIKMKMSGTRVTTSESLLAAILDGVNVLLWSRTEDAEAGKNYPVSIYACLTGSEGPREAEDGEAPCSFASPGDFHAAWKERTGGEG